MAGMAVHRIEELSWAKIRKLAQQNALFMLGLGPLEDHGSHLPSGVDWFLTEGFSRDIAERLLLERPELEVVLMPVYAFGSSVLQDLGCLRLAPSTLTRTLSELVRYLEREGVRRVALMSAHGAVSQGLALNAVCRRFRGQLRCTAPCLPLIARFLSGAFRAPLEQKLGRPFTEEEWKDLRHDTHAGAWETALMLQYRPDLVKEYYAGLPPHVPEKMGLTALRKLRTHRGYFGAPARATVELGAALREVLSEQGARVLLEFLEGKPARARKPLLSPRDQMVAGGLGLAALLTWAWLSRRPARNAQPMKER